MDCYLPLHCIVIINRLTKKRLLMLWRQRWQRYFQNKLCALWLKFGVLRSYLNIFKRLYHCKQAAKMVVRVEDTFQYYRIVDNYYYELVEVSTLFCFCTSAVLSLFILFIVTIIWNNWCCMTYLSKDAVSTLNNRHNKDILDNCNFVLIHCHLYVKLLVLYDLFVLKYSKTLKVPLWSRTYYV